MNWRPDDWIETCDCKDLPPEQQCSMYKNYETGASAMLSAVIKWLDEPCDKHEHSAFNGERYVSYHPHRKDCPQCLNELRGEK